MKNTRGDSSNRSSFLNQSTSANSSLMNSFNKIKNDTLPMAENRIKEKLNEMQPVLSPTQLKNLDKHKYSSSGKTLLDPYFQPFWEWLVLQMPIYLAPNLITVIGLALNVVTSTILMLFSPNATENCPAWTLYLCAIGLFVYQSLDAIDGKQARRTKSSTPLGELFDHGCDAISTAFVSLAVGTALQLGNHPWIMFWQTMAAFCAFYTAHWQTYVTGSLKFGKIDVTEAQVTICFIFALTGLFGDSIWSLQLPILNVEFRFIPVAVAVIGSISSIFTNIEIISQGGKGRNGSSVADTSIVFPIFPLVLFLFMAFSIASKSDIIYLNHKCLYLATFGIVWAKITIKLIIAHMTKGEIYLLDSCLIGPVTLLLNQYFSNLIPELIVLVVSFIIATADLLKYCSKVCYQICTHMNIYLFKISPVIETTPSDNRH